MSSGPNLSLVEIYPPVCDGVNLNTCPCQGYRVKKLLTNG
jgi:hypothetical protein